MRSCAILLAAAACSRPPSLHDDPQAIAYRSRSKVPDAAARQIAAEAVGDARRRPAWSEPNHVHAAGGPIGDGKEKYLFGEARLYRSRGRVEPSGPDAAARKLLTELSTQAGATPLQAEEQRRRLDQKYRDRR